MAFKKKNSQFDWGRMTPVLPPVVIHNLPRMAVGLAGIIFISNLMYTIKMWQALI
jgi:hypothetical protein